MDTSKYTIRIIDASQRLVVIKKCNECRAHDCPPSCDLAGSKQVLTEEEFAELGELNGD